MSREFVFVHGMSHGAWCWRAVAAQLEGKGHRTLAVDLPGHGPRAHEWRQASLARYAAAVAGAMAQASMAGAVLVGHSMAGAVLPGVVERVAARVRHVVFLAAVVVPSGSSLLDTHIPAAVRPLLRGLARAGAGRIQYPASVEHARWMGDLPAGDPRLGEAFRLLTPQPWRPWVDRVDGGRALGRLPRTYVRCLRDAAVPPARAAEYAARLGVRPVDLDADHGVMLSNPGALARLLERL